MFITVDNAKMNLPFPLLEQGQHYWTSVQMPLQNAWFLVTYELGCDDEEEEENEEDCMRATVFVASSDDVVEISKNLKVNQVSLVTPGWMNKSDAWEMESLSEIWQGSEPAAKGGGSATLCVTDSGIQRVITFLETPAEELIDLKRVF